MVIEIVMTRTLNEVFGEDGNDNKEGEDDEDDNGDDEEEDPKEDGGDDEDVTEEEEEDDNDVFKRKGMKMRKGMTIRMIMMLVWKRSLKVMPIRKRMMMKIFKRTRMVIRK